MSRWTPPGHVTTAEPPPALRLLERPPRRAAHAVAPVEGDWLEQQVDRLARWAAQRTPWWRRMPR